MSLRVILVDVIPKSTNNDEADIHFKEAERLIDTLGGMVLLEVIQKRGRPSAKTFLGIGKAKEVGLKAMELGADVVIFNNFLKATQVMHLKKYLNTDIWDRVDLILKIFHKHANTAEAKLQVKLAELKYELPKLHGRGIEFSRLGGGIGTRGPGEQFLEERKREIHSKIKQINKKIRNLKVVRKDQRARRKKQFLTISLVGYTNSGKTSLLKALTNKKNLYIDDKLFATLDTRLGKLWVPNTKRNFLVADTIGFIQDLPPVLITSFLATLEEVQDADLLLHVIDVSDPMIKNKIKTVEKILVQLKCSKKKKIYVFNKVDLVKNKQIITKLQLKYKKFNPVFVSAVKKINLDELKNKIGDRL